MDPDQTVTDLFAATRLLIRSVTAHVLAQGEEDEADAYDLREDYERVVDLRTDLCEWLDRGGYCPVNALAALARSASALNLVRRTA